MTRDAFRFVAVVLACLTPLAAAQARTLEQVDVSDWTVSANGDDTTGAFLNCDGKRDSKTGVGLLFSISKTMDWSMGIFGKLGVIRPGETHVVRYRVDRGTLHSAPATAINQSRVQLRLDDAAGFFEDMGRGRQLTIDGSSERLAFDLKDTQALKTELLDCAGRWTKRAGVAVPGPLTDAERRLEATTVGVNFLSRARIVDFELAPADVPARLVGHDVVWRAQDVMGSLRLVGLDGGTALDKVRAELIAQDIQACAGHFVADSTGGSDGAGTSLFTSCDGEKGWAANYLAVPRAKAGGYVLSLMSEPGKADALKAMAESLRNSATQQVASRTP